MIPDYNFIENVLDKIMCINSLYSLNKNISVTQRIFTTTAKIIVSIKGLVNGTLSTFELLLAHAQI